MSVNCCWKHGAARMSFLFVAYGAMLRSVSGSFIPVQNSPVDTFHGQHRKESGETITGKLATIYI